MEDENQSLGLLKHPDFYFAVLTFEIFWICNRLILWIACEGVVKSVGCDGKQIAAVVWDAVSFSPIAENRDQVANCRHFIPVLWRAACMEMLKAETAMGL